MLIRILMIISLIIASYKGLQHFGVIGSDSTKKEKGEFKKLIKDWDKSKTTAQVKGKIKNINQVTTEDLAVNRKNEIKSKLPNVTLVFGADNSRWVGVLEEEDFTILRELRSKLDQNSEITEEDLRRFKVLESKGVLDAIRVNNPDLMNKNQEQPSEESLGSDDSLDPIEEQPSYPEDEPAYPEAEPSLEPENLPDSRDKTNPEEMEMDDGSIRDEAEFQEPSPTNEF